MMPSVMSLLVCLTLASSAAPIEYADNFAGLPNGDTAAAHWALMTPTWAIQDHALVQSDPTFYGTFAFLRDRVFADFTITAKFLVAPDGSGVRSPGIAFRSRCGSEGYYVQFDSQTSQVLFQVLPPDPNRDEVDLKRVSNVPVAPGQWHEGKVEATGPHFRVSLDGKLLFEVDDATYKTGLVGLRAGQGKVSFKDVSVKGTQGALEKPWKMTPVPKNMQGACDGSKLLKKAERIIAAKGCGYFPVMIKLRDGALGAVIRAGATHLGLGGRLDFIRSTDGGRTWSKPVVAIDSPWDDRNPALGQMPDGTIVLAYGEAHSYRPDGTFDWTAGPYLLFTVTSSDGGLTWSQKRPFTCPWPSASPYGKITVCKDGTALMSLYQVPSNGVGILRSKDSGKTWGDFSLLPGHDETQVTELPDGRLMAFTRMDGERDAGLLLSESNDQGRTWPRTRKLMQSNQWPFDATVLKSGNLLLSYGSRVGHFGAGVLLSRDMGKTWDESQRVLIGWDSVSLDTGFPSAVQLDDGTIVTIYYATATAALPGEQAIAVRYTEQQLTEAMSH
jgi:hypothetical protein